MQNTNNQDELSNQESLFLTEHEVSSLLGLYNSSQDNLPYGVIGTVAYPKSFTKTFECQGCLLN